MEDTNGGTPAASAQDVPPANTISNASSNGSKTKVSLSLGGKKKKSKKTGTSKNDSTSEHFAASTSALAAEAAEDNGTVADRAREVAQNRQEALVIPCVGSGGAGGERNRPLLAGRAQALKTEDSTNDAVKKEEDTEQTAIKSEPDAVIKSENTDDDDAAAAEALIRSAADRTNNNSSSGNVGDTNFDARGNLIIKKEDNTNELLAQAMRGGNIEDDETQEFQRDLARQADDVDVESEAYAAVPIAEFGAAMLRGMGWTGNDDDGKKGANGKKNGDENDDGGMMRPRHHRLGLGAAPRPVAVSTNGNSKPGGRHRALRPHEIERAERERKDEEEFRRRAAERERLDRQRTVQDGSVVRVRRGKNEAVSERRAIMVKTSGVPGLNQVLVRWEGVTEELESVRKSDVLLVEQKELDEKPYMEKMPFFGKAKNKANNDDAGKKSLAASEEETKESSGGDRGRDRDRDRKRDRYNDDQGRDRGRGRYDDSRRDRKKSRSSRDDDRDRSRRCDRDDDLSRDRKRSKKETSDRDDRKERDSGDRRNTSSLCNSESLRWLTPNIRVRMISKKPAKGRQYKEKGVVMDVLPGGAHATVQMTDGEVLDKVPERYLETALPKVGGNAIVLVGDAQHRYAKGRLLERDSSKGQAAIQLFEDMNILTLSLDDFAEWCGPLDSDMMS